MTLHHHPQPAAPDLTAYNALPDREALRLLQKMAERFSGCDAYDAAESAIHSIAAQLAEEEGFRPDRYSMNPEAELGDRYLRAPMSFAPEFELTGARFFGDVFGG